MLWKCQDSCREMPREMPRLVSWKKIFHGKPRIFTRQILRGAMHVHACKSEVINERYCTSSWLVLLIVKVSWYCPGPVASNFVCDLAVEENSYIRCKAHNNICMVFRYTYACVVIDYLSL